MIRDYIKTEVKPQTRPGIDPGTIYGDDLNEALYAKLQEMAEWVAPCTFKRTNKAPIDSKSCFAYLHSSAEGDNSVDTYIDEQYSTAYPGQVVAVTADDSNSGLYVLMSQNVEIEVETDQEDPEHPGQNITTTETVRKLVPVRLGTKAEIEAASSSAVMNWLDQNGHEI